MVTRLENMGCFVTGQHRTDGNTATQCLGTADKIRLDPVLLPAEQAACTADACLHLICHEKDIVLLRQPGCFPDEHRIQGPYAALSLNQFHHDAADRRICHFLLQVFDVVGFHIVKAACEGIEVLVELVLSGGFQSRNRAAMERVLQGQDFCAFRTILIGGVFSGNLDHAFIRFCTGVGKKHFFHQGTVCQPLGSIHHGLCVKQVGCLHESGDLFLNGLHQRFVTVSKGIYANA